MREPTKLQVRIWGLSVNAEGVVAIGAALIIVMSVLAFYRL